MPKSTKKTPGFVIASGSISKYLVGEEDMEEFYLGVFISNDAGLTWRMIARGRMLFEIINNGSVIVLAHKFFPTKYIQYSLNNGVSFEKLAISDTPIEIYALTVKDS